MTIATFHAIMSEFLNPIKTVGIQSLSIYFLFEFLTLSELSQWLKNIVLSSLEVAQAV